MIIDATVSEDTVTFGGNDGWYVDIRALPSAEEELGAFDLTYIVVVGALEVTGRSGAMLIRFGAF